MAMKSLSIYPRSSHIHQCRRREMLLESPSAEFYYRCAQWFRTFKDWEQHCEWHIRNLDSRCEIFTYRYTLIVPGTCPFCVGRCETGSAQRFHQWLSSEELWKHVGKHLSGASWPMSCPNPLCSFEIGKQELFYNHMIDEHGKTKLERKRKYRMRRTWQLELKAQEHPVEYLEESSDEPDEQIVKRSKNYYGRSKRYPGQTTFLLNKYSSITVEDALADTATVVPML